MAWTTADQLRFEADSMERIARRLGLLPPATRQTWDPRTPLATEAVAQVLAAQSRLAYEREQALDAEAYQED